MATVNKPRPGQKFQTRPPQTTTTHNNNSGIAILIVILILAVLAAGYFFGYPLIREYFNSRNATTIQKIAPVDSLPVVKETPIVQEKLIPAIPKGYYIIVGSFRNKTNADRMVQNMSKNIHLDVLYFEQLGFYRVSTGYYENIRKAYSNVFQVQSIDGCNNAWVLENL